MGAVQQQGHKNSKYKCLNRVKERRKKTEVKKTDLKRNESKVNIHTLEEYDSFCALAICLSLSLLVFFLWRQETGKIDKCGCPENLFVSEKSASLCQRITLSHEKK